MAQCQTFKNRSTLLKVVVGENHARMRDSNPAEKKKSMEMEQRRIGLLACLHIRSCQMVLSRHKRLLLFSRDESTPNVAFATKGKPIYHDQQEEMRFPNIAARMLRLSWDIDAISRRPRKISER